MRNSLKVKIFAFQNIDVTLRQCISYVQIQVIVFEKVSHYFEILCQYFDIKNSYFENVSLFLWWKWDSITRNLWLKSLEKNCDEHSDTVWPSRKTNNLIPTMT